MTTSVPAPRVLVAVASIATGLVVGAASPAAAQIDALQPDAVDPALLERYAGTYTYAEHPDHGRAVIKQAFDEAIEQIPRLFRPMLRKNMAERDYLVTSFSIRPRGDQIAFRAVSYRVFAVATLPGVTRELTSKRGRVTKVTQRFVGESFEQVIENRRGQQRNLLTLLDDGRTVHVVTTFTSRYLDEPVSFELRYARVEPRVPPRREPPTAVARLRAPPRRGPRRVAIVEGRARPRRVAPARFVRITGLSPVVRTDEVSPDDAGPVPRPDQDERESPPGDTPQEQPSSDTRSSPDPSTSPEM